MMSVSVGDALPIFERHLDAVRLVAYAGATWDWHRLHHDQAYVVGRGMPGTIVDGQLYGALFAEQVQDAFGPSARVVRMDLRFNALVFAGETITVTGEVVGVESLGSVTEVVVRHSVTSDTGTIAVKDARTTLWVPSEGEGPARAWESLR